MKEMEDEHDLPTSAPKGEGAAGGGHGGGSDSEDETAPDFSQLTALAKRHNAQQSGGAGLNTDKGDAAPFIPKRGEKDFEPTGFAGQNRALENSRKAMFEVISSQRVISSKSISIALWEPTLQRAIVQLVRGQTFNSMGVSNRVALLEDGQFEDLAKIDAARNGSDGKQLPSIAGTIKEGVFWPKMQSRLELLPEEALYLIERGSMECRVRTNGQGVVQASQLDRRDYDEEGEEESDGISWVPMSVEQAYAMMLSADGLTRPRYQLYAQLRRLGYIVQRKSISDSLRASATAKNTATQSSEHAEASGQEQKDRAVWTQATSFALHIIRTILDPFRHLVHLPIQGLAVGRNSIEGFLSWMRRIAFRLSRPAESLDKSSGGGRRGGLLGIGAAKWESYDAIFDRLRIVPTGHELLADTKPAHRKGDAMPEIFFYAWRPATHFKKSDPPLPEYQLAVVDARHTSLPSAYAFSDMFANVPMPVSANDVDQLDEEEQKAWKLALEQKRKNDESYGRGAVRKQREALEASKRQANARNREEKPVSAWEKVKRWTGLSGAADNRNVQRKRVGPGGGGVNIYIPLKAGRRNVIVAVNDCATTSLLRFGEAEFARWRVAGTKREGR